MKIIRELAKEQLPPRIYKELVEECKSQNCNYILDQEPFNEGKWLGGVLMWSVTKKGLDYWDNINQRYVIDREYVRTRRVNKLENANWKRIGIKIVKIFGIPAIALLIMYLFGSCTVYQPALLPLGKVVKVEGDNAFVSFEDGNKVDRKAGEWFTIPNAKINDVYILQKQER